MKKILAIALTLTMVFSITACSTSGATSGTSAAGTTPSAGADMTAAETPAGTPAASQDPIYLGVQCRIDNATILPQEGAIRAAKEINEAGGLLGGRMIELVIEDDNMQADEAINVANKFSQPSRKITGVIGPWTSTCTLAVYEIYEKAGIPFIVSGTAATLEELDKVNDASYTFLGRASDRTQADIAANYVIENFDVKKIGILYETTDYGEGGYRALDKIFKEKNYEVSAQAIGYTDVDITTQLIKLRQSGCEIIVAWTVNVVVASRQMFELGMADIPVVNSSQMATASYYTQCEAAWIENWVSVTDYFNEGDAFAQGIEADFGHAAELSQACYYGYVYTMAAAIEAAGSSDPKAVRDALAAITQVETPIGIARCDESHVLNHTSVIVGFKDREPYIVGKFEL